MCVFVCASERKMKRTRTNKRPKTTKWKSTEEQKMLSFAVAYKHTHTHVYILTRHYTNTTLLKAFFTAPLLFFLAPVPFGFSLHTRTHTQICLFRWCFVADFVFCENNVHIKNQIFCVTFSPWNVFGAHEQSIGMASGKPNHQIISKHTVSHPLSPSRICDIFCIFYAFASAFA